MRRWIKRIAIATGMLSATGLITTWWAVRQSQQVPEFYTRATQSISAERRVEQSRHMVDEMERLKADAADVGQWQATFSIEEINAWLAEELPVKFPRLLRGGASDPRVMIENNRLLAAARFKNHRLDVVISCELQVKLTEEPNMLALRVVKLKAGALPLPLNQFAEGISKEAARGEVDIRWDVTETGPIALVTVPSEHPKYTTGPVIVESVELVEGALVVSGRSGSIACRSYQPSGPVYRFVSFRPGSKNRHQLPRLTSRRNSSSAVFR